MVVHWTDPAIEDLKSIRQYIGRDSNFYAESFTEDLFNQTSLLEKNPELGRRVPENKKYREILHRGYRIIYEVDEKKGGIFIITVFHGAKELRFPRSRRGQKGA